MATAGGNRKQVPPSRKRYEETHPVVSVRLSPELRHELDLLKFESGMNTADVIRIAVDKAKPDLKAAYERGVEDGYETASQIYEVSYPCSECGEWDLSITSDEEKELVAEFMRQQGWHHTECR